MGAGEGQGEGKGRAGWGIGRVEAGGGQGQREGRGRAGLVQGRVGEGGEGRRQGRAGAGGRRSTSLNEVLEDPGELWVLVDVKKVREGHHLPLLQEKWRGWASPVPTCPPGRATLLSRLHPPGQPAWGGRKAERGWGIADGGVESQAGQPSGVQVHLDGTVPRSRSPRCPPQLSVGPAWAAPPLVAMQPLILPKCCWLVENQMLMAKSGYGTNPRLGT